MSLNSEPKLNYFTDQSHGIDLKSDLLDDLSASFQSQFIKEKIAAKEMFDLWDSTDNKDAIERKINSISHNENKLQISLLEGLTSFKYLLTANDSELEYVYYKYFEPQNSKYYLGAVESALHYQAFREGFFSAYKSNYEEVLSPNLLKLIQITEKMSQIQKKLA